MTRHRAHVGGTRESQPIDDAIYLLKRVGCSGAKEYAQKALDNAGTFGVARWQAVVNILAPLSCRQTQAVHVAHLLRRKAQLENSVGGTRRVRAGDE